MSPGATQGEDWQLYPGGGVGGGGGSSIHYQGVGLGTGNITILRDIFQV